MLRQPTSWYVSAKPSFFDEADEVHVSVTFTWDIPIAEWLAKQWEPVATAMGQSDNHDL